MLASDTCENPFTEYFVRGSAPTRMYVPPPPALPEAPRVAANEGAHEPARVDAVPFVPPAPATVAASEAPPPATEPVAPPSEPPKKKHGFWGKLFGKH